jgi:uncharacterized protein (TIGR02001 family)
MESALLTVVKGFAPRAAESIVLLALVVAPSAACAGTFEGSVQFASDYVVRGVSQSDGGGAVQGGVQYRGDRGEFAGVWASPVVFDPAEGRKPEIDLYAGRRWDLSPRVAVQATLTRYVYPRDREALRYDYSELGVQFDLDDRLTLALGWTPDYSRFASVGIARDRSMLSAELSGRQPIGAGFTVNASVAYSDLHDLFGRGYWAWGAGLAWSSGTWSASAQRLGADSTATRWFGADRAGARWAATLTRRF